MAFRDNWQSLLFAEVRARKTTPFQYGKHDCCIAAADLIQTIMDIDLMKGLRGRYRSAAGAARVIKAEGFHTLESLLEARVIEAGGHLMCPAHVSMGDLVITDKALHDQLKGAAVGLCLGRKFIFPGEIGWVNLSRSDLIAAFSMQN